MSSINTFSNKFKINSYLRLAALTDDDDLKQSYILKAETLLDDGYLHEEGLIQKESTDYYTITRTLELMSYMACECELELGVDFELADVEHYSYGYIGLDVNNFYYRFKKWFKNIEKNDWVKNNFNVDFDVTLLSKKQFIKGLSQCSFCLGIEPIKFKKIIKEAYIIDLFSEELEDVQFNRVWFGSDWEWIKEGYNCEN